MFAAGRLNAVLKTFSNHNVRQGVNVARTVTGTGTGRRAMSLATSPSRQPLLLYTWGTPNGRKASIMLEELKAMYGLDYDVHPINISTNVQKEPWFTKLNPNGRIPVLVDRNRDDFTVFETAAILLYLEQHYDTQQKFGFDPNTQANDYSQMLQWMFFAHGAIGPMQGQRTCFVATRMPAVYAYAKKRYLDETKRLYGVLNIRLVDREWLAGPGGGTYSIADINAFPWVRGHGFAGIETLDEWPGVKAWVERCSERPAVKAGLHVP